MAVRYAVASGNWSSTSIWNGGTLPQAGDDVHANGFLVNVDQNINVAKISTETNPITSISGGQFNSRPNTILICNITSGPSVCLYCNNNNGRNLRITGNVTATNAVAISMDGVAHLTQLIGNVYGGLTPTAFGISLTGYLGDQSNNIIGNLISSVGAAYSSATVNNDSIIGNIYASPSAVGIQNNGGFSIIGNLFNSGGYMAIRTQRAFINNNNQIQWLVQNQSSQNIQLYSSDYFVGMPSDSDVRKGVTYGVANSLTGSLAVPPTGSVALGVPVDSGVGTAMISVQDMGTLLASYVV
jgi:hypothetical protein